MGCGGSKAEEAGGGESGGSPKPNVPTPQRQKDDGELERDAEVAKKVSDPAQESSRRRGAPSKAGALVKPSTSLPLGGLASQPEADEEAVGGGENGAEEEEEEKGDEERGAAAIELVRETLAANRAALGDKHASTLTSINNLATLLQDAGELDEAEALFREALEKRREVLGATDPSTLTSINNLGMLLQEKEQTAECEALLREALQARRQALGVDHTDTQDSLFNLGRLLQDKGGEALAEAAGLLREELQGSAKAKGKDDEAVAESALNLRGLLLETGRREEAVALAAEYSLPAAKESDVVSIRLLEKAQGKVSAEALEQAKAEHGEKHATTLTLMNDLGSLLHDEQKLDEAERLFREALRLRREVLGDKDQATLTSVNNLGLLLKDKGDAASQNEALGLLREALEARRQVLGADHEETADALFNLGSMLQEREEFEEATTLLAEELTLSAARSGKDSSDVLDSASNLHGLYIKAGRAMDAARLIDAYGLGPGGEVPEPAEGGGGEGEGAARKPKLETQTSVATKVAYGRDEFNS